MPFPPHAKGSGLWEFPAPLLLESIMYNPIALAAATVVDPILHRIHQQMENQDTEEPNTESEADLNALKKEDLISLAQHRKVKINKSWTKAKIIEAITGTTATASA